MLDKRGQIADTLTWVIATTAIIVILILSISIVQFGFKGKSFSAQGGTSDLLVAKSMTGYLLGEGVYGQVKKEEALNDYTGNLALNIFRNFYEIETKYLKVWVGVNFKGVGLRTNSYFGSLPILRGGELSIGNKKYVSEKIILNEDKYLEFFSTRKSK